jgi:hypothetical protein
MSLVRGVERALARAEFPRLEERIELALIVAGIALGVGTIVLVVFAA